MSITSINNIYMAVLSTLTKENKIALATMLLNSATGPEGSKEPLTLNTRFSGDWGEGESADRVAEDLRNDRKFTREVETW